MPNEDMCCRGKTINDAAVPLSRTGRGRSNSLHVSLEVRDVVRWVRQRRCLRGGEELSGETECCAIHTLVYKSKKKAYKQVIKNIS